MNRREFIRMCNLLGLGIPLLSSCASLKTTPLTPSDKVVIIGAGAAGLTSAYLLNQKGIHVEVLEANSEYGGRMKRTTEFADFPIPLGAEWLHTKRKVLDTIVNDPSVKIDVATVPYDFDVDYALADGKKISLKRLGFTIDQKFINSTWFDFFEGYVVPSIEGRISFNKVVTSIDYSSDKIVVKTKDEEYLADKVIVTVPVKILQDDLIEFSPALPSQKIEAINKVTVWGGCKAFIEFSEKFYPVATVFDITSRKSGDRMYYDASYGQDTSRNILGLFTVGPVAEQYMELSGEALIKHILTELDQNFEGRASKSYMKHIFHNWVDQPFARGAYVHSFESWRRIRTLGKPVDNKLYFAGDAYTDGSDWSSVHAAAESAKRVVEELVG